MYKDRLLFLDIDGVVNTLMIYDKEQEDRRKLIYKDGYYFELNLPGDGKVSNKQAMLWVSKLCTDYSLSIVITSTWLIDEDVADIATELYNSGLSTMVPIIGGVSKKQQVSRGWQIESWLEDNKIDPDKATFIILDDDVDMVGYSKDLTKYLVKCDSYVGFTHSEYVKACELLDKQIERED